MKRTLIAVAAIIGLATAANAASVTVTSDQASYNLGETITLTVNVSTLPAEASTQVFGDLILSGTGSVSGGVSTQAPLQSFGGAIVWVTGLSPCTPAICTAMNQIGGLSPFPVTNTPLNIAIITYTAAGAGTVNVNWDPSTFDFFLAPLPAGTSFTIVPEPTTAALLGLGLLGLAVSGRRRA
jgi:hypothetical protein